MTIQEILDDLKIEYLESGHQHCREGWLQIRNCPFCQSSNYHLGWNLSGQWCSCWRCGGHYGPKVLTALGVPYERARLLFSGLDAQEGPSKRERTRFLLQEPQGKGSLQRSHRRYLESRGFDPDEISRLWHVEGIGLSSNLAWRLYIPVIQRGVRVSWTTRAIGDRVTQRYISAPADKEAVNIKDCCYGIDYCHHSVVICEGPADAWKVGPGGVALFGTTFSTAQVRKLINIPRRFVCFDSSDEAQKKATELAGQLSVFPGTTENILLDSKDPGEASPKEIKLLKKVAKL